MKKYKNIPNTLGWTKRKKTRSTGFLDWKLIWDWHYDNLWRPMRHLSKARNFSSFDLSSIDSWTTGGRKIYAKKGLSRSKQKGCFQLGNPDLDRKIQIFGSPIGRKIRKGISRRILLLEIHAR